MRRFSDKHQHSTLAELNVTPLLDLAFVLLIIFMITTPLMDKSVDLVVPSSKAATDAVKPSDVNSVSVDRHGIISFQSQAMGVDDLKASLVALKKGQPEAAVVIRAHKELPVQKLVDILDVVKSAEITKVGVVTTEEQ